MLFDGKPILLTPSGSEIVVRSQKSKHSEGHSTAMRQGHVADIKDQVRDFKRFASGIKPEGEDNTVFYENFLHSLKENEGHNTTKHHNRSSNKLITKTGTPPSEKKPKYRGSVSIGKHSSSYLLFKPKKMDSKFTPIKIKDIKTFKGNFPEIPEEVKVIATSKTSNNFIVDIKSSNNSIKAITPKSSYKDATANSKVVSSNFSPNLHNNSKGFKPTSPKRSDQNISHYYINQASSNKELKAKAGEQLEPPPQGLQLSSIDELSREGKKKSLENKNNNPALIGEPYGDHLNKDGNDIKSDSPENDSQSYTLKKRKSKFGWFKCCIPIG